jgi:serine/threonine protein kinase
MGGRRPPLLSSIAPGRRRQLYRRAGRNSPRGAPESCRSRSPRSRIQFEGRTERGMGGSTLGTAACRSSGSPPRSSSRRRPLPLGEPMELGRFLRLAVGISMGLGKLHQRGLIHKDIKPANILVNCKDEHVRLTGFGIASRLLHRGCRAAEASQHPGTRRAASPLMGWSGRAPAPPGDDTGRGRQKTRSTPMPRINRTAAVIGIEIGKNSFDVVGSIAWVQSSCARSGHADRSRPGSRHCQPVSSAWKRASARII